MIENGPLSHPRSLHRGREISFAVIGTSHGL